MSRDKPGLEGNETVGTFNDQQSRQLAAAPDAGFLVVGTPGRSGP